MAPYNTNKNRFRDGGLNRGVQQLNYSYILELKNHKGAENKKGF